LHGPRAAEIRIALAAEQRIRAQAALADSEWERTRALYERSVVTDAERIRAQTAREAAHREVSEAEDRLKLLRSGTRAEDLAAAQARVEAAQASLQAASAAAKQAEVAVERCRVTAPFTGIVAHEWRQPGATVAPGTPILTLLDPATLHVAANIDEKQLAGVHPGDSVAISVDAFPNVQLHGHVDTILRATNSEFGLVPAEGVSGTFIKVAQRVPLRISLDAPPPALDLSPGLSVEVRIRVASVPAPHAALSSRD
jgi:membrane fusion protein (multidrug efflux system)